MKSILFLIPLVAASATQTDNATESAAQDAVIGTSTVHGCYSSVGDLTFGQSETFNTEGLCSEYCSNQGSYVAATQDKACYCGSTYPPTSALVDDSECSTACPGFDAEACGGPDAFTVYNTGLSVDVADSGSSSSSGSSNSTSTSTSVSSSSSGATASNGTVTVTTASPSGTSVPASGADRVLSGLGMAVAGLGAALLL